MFIHLIFVSVPKTNNMTFLSFQIAGQMVLLVSDTLVGFFLYFFKKVDIWGLKNK